MYKVQHGIAPDIMNDNFRRRNMRYNKKSPLALKQGIRKLFILNQKQLRF